MNCHFIIKCFRLALSCHLCHLEDVKQQRSELGQLKGGSRGNFMLQHPLLLYQRSSARQPAWYPKRKKGQSGEQLARDAVRRLYSPELKGNALNKQPYKTSSLILARILAQKQGSGRLSSYFKNPTALKLYNLKTKVPQKKKMCTHLIQLYKEGTDPKAV